MINADYYQLSVDISLISPICVLFSQTQSLIRTLFIFKPCRCSFETKQPKQP